MHTVFLQSMQDALQLVKSGQVLQATAAIQMALNGNQPIVPNKPLEQHIVDNAKKNIHVIHVFSSTNPLLQHLDTHIAYRPHPIQLE